MTDVPYPRPRERGHAIPATCATHKYGIGFTNLMVSKRDGGIELDPHVAGACVITLDEVAATALLDLLGEWFG